MSYTRSAPKSPSPHTPPPPTPPSVAILAQVGNNHAGFSRLGFCVIATVVQDTTSSKSCCLAFVSCRFPMVKRVLLLMVLMGPALALICGSKAPSSSSLFVIRDNEVGVDPALMLGNSIKCGPAQTLLSLVDFMGMLPGHTSGVETVFFMGRMVCTLSSPSMVVCFGLSHSLSLRSLTCLRSNDCDCDFMRVAMKVSQGCFQDGFAVTLAANGDVMDNFSFWVVSISVELLPSSNLFLVLEDVRAFAGNLRLIFSWTCSHLGKKHT